MLRRFIPFADDLWTNRALLWQFTLRNVELRHKGSHLGLIWSFLNPLLMMGLYVVVFGYIFGGSFGVLPHETRVDYALGIFFGLTLFQFIAEVMGLAPIIIISNPNFVKKVIFPLEILPASNVGAALFHLMIGLALALLGALIFERELHWQMFWLPVIIAPLVLFSLGVAWLLSALGVFLRDIGQIMQFLVMALMYASAVFFPVSKIIPSFWIFLRFNPVLLAIGMARDTALWAQPINYHHLIYLYVIGFVCCSLGHLAFRKMKPAFADVL